MGLKWALTDRPGNRLAEIRQRESSEVTVALNGIRRAKATVSMYDAPTAQVYPLARRMKVWLDAEILFNGPLLNPKFSFARGDTEIAAIGPEHNLERRFVPFPAVWAPTPEGAVYTLSYVQIGAGETMARLVEAVTPNDHGIVRGNIEPGILLDRYYEPGVQFWRAVSDLSVAEGGPDFDFRPLDRRTDGICAALDTHEQGMGSDKSKEVVFEYGTGRHNCADVVWEPDGSGVVTRHTTMAQAELGFEPPHYTASSEEAEALFGTWEDFEPRPDYADTQPIESIAEGIVSAQAFPQDFIDLYPAVEGGRDAAGNLIEESLGIPPRCGPQYDYWIGDTVKVIAKKGYARVEAICRVVEVTLRDVVGGNVQAVTTVVPRVWTVNVAEASRP